MEPAFDPQSQRPLNRAERRRLEKLRRKRRKHDGPAPQPEVPAPELSAPEQPATSPSRADDLQIRLLEEWRGVHCALFEDTRSVVCRAAAYACVLHTCRNGADPALRVRAAAIARRHSAAVPRERRAASQLVYATALVRMGRLSDLIETLAQHPGVDRAAEIAEELCSWDERHELLRRLDNFAWAELLTAVFYSRNANLRLRAARTLLQATLPEARRKGRDIGRALTQEELELLAEIRTDLDAARPMPPPSPEQPPREPAPAYPDEGTAPP